MSTWTAVVDDRGAVESEGCAEGVRMKKIETVVLFTAALLAIPAAFAQAPAYPTKPVKVVPFSPGGASDLTARTLAQKMGESMGQRSSSTTSRAPTA